MTDHIQTIFELQQKNKAVLQWSTAQQRILKLRRLKTAIEEFEEQIYDALQTDLRKSKFESALTEVFFALSEIDFAIKNLKQWMKPKRVRRTLTSILATNRIYQQPRGVCLIIAPWNYPFQLIMSPLISAIAAGNCIILKPSEISSATSNVITQLIKNTFQEEDIACFEGDRSISEFLLQLPFDHIFFTGSTTVGKVVMQAASKNLSTVTLELGGKSPVIIDETADIKDAASKIAWGKLINAGQTCIAPDHVFIQRSKLEEFIQQYKEAVTRQFFNDQQQLDMAQYSKIINRQHAERLVGLITDAVDNGASIAWGGEVLWPELTIYPTLLSHVPLDSKIMQEEIFGPILPVIPYDDLEMPLNIINSKSKPLALYIFSKNKLTVKRLLKGTSSGGACINDVVIHVSNPNLPFGGVNGSGMGSCHGIFGFKTFSHERSVAFQSAFNMSQLIYPPYTKKEWVMKLLRKFM